VATDRADTTAPEGATGHALTRRALLSAGGAASLALAIPGHALARTRRSRAASHLRRSSYRPLLRQRFTVVGSRVRLRLISIEDLNSHQANSEHAFALNFWIPRGAPPLQDDVPQLYHPRLGSFKFMVSPGRIDGYGQRYCVIINRLHA
jgi:hypothetical protein